MKFIVLSLVLLITLQGCSLAEQSADYGRVVSSCNHDFYPKKVKVNKKQCEKDRKVVADILGEKISAERKRADRLVVASMFIGHYFLRHVIGIMDKRSYIRARPLSCDLNKKDYSRYQCEKDEIMITNNLTFWVSPYTAGYRKIKGCDDAYTPRNYKKNKKQCEKNTKILAKILGDKNALKMERKRAHFLNFIGD